MQKKSFVTSLFITALTGTTVLFSGCSQASPNTPVGELQKSFKTSVNSQEFGKAVEQAASAKGWSVSNTSEDKSVYRLKKTYIQTYHDMMEEDETYDVFVDVTYVNNEMKTKLSEMTKGATAVCDLNQELGSLQKAINNNLILSLKAPLQNTAFSKAIKQAAATKGWTVSSSSESTNAYRLNKNYLQTYHDIMEEPEHHNVSVEVTVTDNKMNFKVTDMTEGASAVFHADQEFASLEKAINQNMLMSIEPSYNKEEFKKAVEQMAAIEGWSITEAADDKSTYRLKKTIVQTYHDMMEPDEYHDVYVDVTLADNKMDIKVVNMTKGISADFNPNHEIVSLEKAINQKLRLSEV
jgi:hypothetical protein